ncbi:MAG: hypothetical protein AAF957_20440 [Planctomycetota bacterium]
MTQTPRIPLPRGPRGHTLVDAQSSALTPVESAIQRFFRTLEKRGVPVLALRGARRAPHYRESTNLDVVCLPRHRGRVDEALVRSLERYGVIVVTRQSSRYQTQYQVYAPCGPGRHHHLCIDLTIAQACRGVPYLFPADLFRGRDTQRSPHRPSPVMGAMLEFLGPFLYDGRVDSDAVARLAVTYEKNPAQLRALFGRIAGTRAADGLCRALREPGFGAIEREAHRFRRGLLRKSFVDRPIPTVRGLLSKFWTERVVTWFRPRGMTVVLLGAEGTGKTTLARELLAELAPSFRSRWNLIVPFEKRRRVRRRKGASRPGRVATWLRATRMWAGASFHYALRVQPLRRRNTLVVFDRWIDDWFADPERYGLRADSAYVRFLAKNTPRPDVVLVTTGSTRVLRRRRPLLSKREMLRQLDTYASYAEHEPRAYVVHGDQALDDTVDAAVLAVLARSTSPTQPVRREPAVVSLQTRAA